MAQYWHPLCIADAHIGSIKLSLDTKPFKVTSKILAVKVLTHVRKEYQYFNTS